MTEQYIADLRTKRMVHNGRIKVQGRWYRPAKRYIGEYDCSLDGQFVYLHRYSYFTGNPDLPSSLREPTLYVFDTEKYDTWIPEDSEYWNQWDSEIENSWLLPAPF